MWAARCFGEQLRRACLPLVFPLRLPQPGERFGVKVNLRSEIGRFGLIVRGGLAPVRAHDRVKVDLPERSIESGEIHVFLENWTKKSTQSLPVTVDRPKMRNGHQQLPGSPSYPHLSILGVNFFQMWPAQLWDGNRSPCRAGFRQDFKP